jgi:ElaB/YqjD/DUF883 family membrane-anchored ribosome-binding protein
MLLSKLQEENPMTNQKTDYRHESDRLRDLAVTATDRLKDAGEKAQEMASEVADQARQYGEKAQDAAREFRPFVERSLREQPMATLAAAAVIGFVLGALWKK